MPCDMFWTSRILGFEYTIRLRGNEEYHFERIEKNKSLLPNPYENLWVNVMSIIVIWKMLYWVYDEYKKKMKRT
jgi:hypothetical protein